MCMKMCTRQRCISNICTSMTWLLILLLHNILVTDVYGDNWEITRINTHKITQMWTITNYSMNDLKNGEELNSLIFSGDDSDKYKWQLQLYPKGEGKSDTDWITLYLHSKNEINVTASSQLYIMDGNGKKTNMHSFTHIFTSGYAWGWDRFVLQSDLNNKTKNLLPDDSLTILVEIIVKEGITKLSGNCRFANNVSNREYITGQLLENSFLSDVKLHVDGQVIQAHRVVLAMQSSTFLQELTKNPNLDVIHVQNTTIAATKQALHFMYTGKLEMDEEDVKELLSLSNQLGIPQLKLMCEEALCKSMRPSNATQILMLADIHDAKNLAREASNYIAGHAATVVDSPDFKELEKSYPNPFYNILRKIVNKKKD